MKHLIFVILLLSFQYTFAQVFDTETIKNSGDNDKRINLVILSEGYRESELAKFKTNAINFTTELFNQSPFKEYANYFNVHIIKVASNQSGADHPGTSTNPMETPTSPLTPVINVDTYFNATYDSFGSHRLLYYEIDGYSANNTQLKITNLLATNFPTYDQALILVNSAEYGGSGGEFPMAYTGSWGSKVIMHELGHSLFNLKDEYYPGDELAAEAINMTQETNANLVKWKNWLNINGVGIHQYTCNSGNCARWYKPHQNCIMESIDKSFCSVCKEGMVEKIHSLQSPIDSYIPVSNELISPLFPLEFQLNLIKPVPNTLKSNWVLNNINFASDLDAVSISETDLNEGMNTLTVSVNDETSLLKVNNHDTFHLYTITWNIDNSTLGIKNINSEIANYNISMFPNPTNDIVNLKFESDSNTDLKVDIVSLDGKMIKTVSLTNYLNSPVDLSNLSTGIYVTNFYSGNALIASRKLIKN
ncbi:M64 family metallopeptidase [Mariniflexile sp.]|uniref:T9SS type A sorting domain-containing protein n=1 Tax=Mariniflexile sp. TaxID=1979402 RepID=UPI00356B5D07